jgi:hypothetical protein
MTKQRRCRSYTIPQHSISARTRSESIITCIEHTGLVWFGTYARQEAGQASISTPGVQNRKPAWGSCLRQGRNQTSPYSYSLEKGINQGFIDQYLSQNRIPLRVENPQENHKNHQKLFLMVDPQGRTPMVDSKDNSITLESDHHK